MEDALFNVVKIGLYSRPIVFAVGLRRLASILQDCHGRLALVSNEASVTMSRMISSHRTCGVFDVTLPLNSFRRFPNSAIATGDDSAMLRVQVSHKHDSMTTQTQQTRTVTDTDSSSQTLHHLLLDRHTKPLQCRARRPMR